MKTLFLLLSFVSFTYGQNTVIEYQVLPNTTSEAFRGMMLSASDLETNLKLVTLSLVYNENEMKFYASIFPPIVNDDLGASLFMTDIQGIYHRKNNSDDLYVEIDKFGDEENFIIRKKWITDWKLTDEKKMICGHECFKATSTLKVDYGDNDVNALHPIVAWYCPEIKYSYGPKAYGHLPGMILEVDGDFAIYRAEKICTDTSNEKIALPTDKKIITESTMYDLMDETIKKAVNKCQSESKKAEILKKEDIRT